MGEIIKVTSVLSTLLTEGLKDPVRQWISEGHSLIYSASISWESTVCQVPFRQTLGSEQRVRQQQSSPSESLRSSGTLTMSIIVKVKCSGCLIILSF